MSDTFFENGVVQEAVLLLASEHLNKELSWVVI